MDLSYSPIMAYASIRLSITSSVENKTLVTYSPFGRMPV